MNEGAPIPYKDIDELTRTLSARDSLANETIVALRGRFPGPISNDEKRLASYLIEELATQPKNLSLGELEERWHKEEKERKAEEMKEAIGESIPLINKENEDFEDLLDEAEEKHELTPEQAEEFRRIALSGITNEKERLKAKWMLQQASGTSKTLKELAEEWEEKQAAIAEDDKQKGISSEPKSYTVTTGEFGTGTAHPGSPRPPTEGL